VLDWLVGGSIFTNADRIVGPHEDRRDLHIVRPADANETAVAWRTIVEHTDRPAGLVLSRQDLPTIDRSRQLGPSTDEDDFGLGASLANHVGTPGDAFGRGVFARSLRPTGSRPASSRCRAKSGSTSRTRSTASRCYPAQ
jgi:hypothetical protein